jgi:hypothetical protein
MYTKHVLGHVDRILLFSLHELLDTFNIIKYNNNKLDVTYFESCPKTRETYYGRILVDEDISSCTDSQHHQVAHGRSSSAVRSLEG